MFCYCRFRVLCKVPFVLFCKVFSFYMLPFFRLVHGFLGNGCAHCDQAVLPLVQGVERPFTRPLTEALVRISYACRTRTRTYLSNAAWTAVSPLGLDLPHVRSQHTTGGTDCPGGHPPGDHPSLCVIVPSSLLDLGAAPPQQYTNHISFSGILLACLFAGFDIDTLVLDESRRRSPPFFNLLGASLSRQWRSSTYVHLILHSTESHLSHIMR